MSRTPSDAAALQSVPLPVIVLDAAGRALRVNAMAEALLGDAARIGEQLDGGFGVVDAVRRCQVAPRAVVAASTTVDDGSGTAVPAVVTVAAVHDADDDEVEGFVVTVVPSLPVAGQDSSVRSLAVVAHEVRNPLTSLRTALDLARLELGPADAGQQGSRTVSLLDLAQRNALRIQRLLEEFVAADQHPVPRPRSRRRELPVPGLLDSAVSSVSGIAQRHGVEVRVQRRRDMAEVVWGDEGPLVQVLINLLANALRHSNSGSTVELSAVTSPVGVELVVDDRGSGIRSSLLPHVFEAFQHGRSARDSAGGEGLGLHIVDRIVRAHEGSVFVRSRFGAGTAVSVSLPQRCHARSVEFDRRRLR